MMFVVRIYIHYAHFKSQRISPEERKRLTQAIRDLRLRESQEMETMRNSSLRGLVIGANNSRTRSGKNMIELMQLNNNLATSDLLIEKSSKP